MKKLTLLLAVLFMIFASCTKEETIDPITDPSPDVITYKIYGTNYDIQGTLGDGKTLYILNQIGPFEIESEWTVETNPLIMITPYEDQAIEIQILLNGEVVEHDEMGVPGGNTMQLEYIL